MCSLKYCLVLSYKRNEDKMKKQIKKISLNDTSNRYLVLDTETIHSALIKDNQLQEIKDIIEISWKVLDCDGIEIDGSKKGFLVEEFWNDKDYLSSLNFMATKDGIVAIQNFAIGKLNAWQNHLDLNHLQIKKWGAIMKVLAKDIVNYNVSLFSAYNIIFDRQAIVSTSKLMNYNSYCKELWELDFVDIMALINIFGKNKKFKKWADNHGAISSSGNYLCKAETIYRYLVNNNEEWQLTIPDSYDNWGETHIALEDIDCEGVILQAIISQSRRKREIKVEVNKYGHWKTWQNVIKLANQKKDKKAKQLAFDLTTD